MNVQLAPNTSADKRESILESTLKLIRQYGFHGTAMNQIAQEAHVAIGTIYHYFESKDDLMLATLEHCKRMFNESAFQNADKASAYRVRLDQIWINLVSFYIEHPDVLSFLEQFYSSPYVKQLLGNETVCGQDTVGDFLQEGILGGHIKEMDVNVVSSAFIGTAIAAAKRTSNRTFVFEDDHKNHMLSILWEGIKI